MGFATARTISLSGATGHLVDVQADVSQGLVATALVGRPDVSISEARDRCRAAITNSRFTWPATRRITILLSPADLPKRGPHFDLAIAVSVLAAAGPRLASMTTRTRCADTTVWRATSSSGSSPSTAGCGACQACCR